MDSRRILVVGVGAENICSPMWAQCVQSLREIGHEVFGLDPLETERLLVRRSVEDQVQWVFDHFRPQLVAMFGSGSPLDRLVDSVAADGGIPEIRIAAEELSVEGSTEASIELPVLLEPSMFDSDLDYVITDPVDVLMLGPASEGAVRAARQIVKAGKSLRLAGEGWDTVPELRPFAGDSVAYPCLGSVLRSAGLLVVVPGTVRPTRTSVGPVHAALAAAYVGTPVVALAGSAVEHYLTAGAQMRVVTEDTLTLALQADPATAMRVASARQRVATDWLWSDRWHEVLGERAGDRPAVRVTKEGPALSFYLPMYNAAAFVGEAMQSLLAQTVRDIEVVVFDDGSTDNSVEVVRRFQSDSRVRIVEGNNVGQTGRLDYANNEALRATRSDYISLVGADDIVPINRADMQLELLRNDPDIDIAHGAGTIIDERGQVVAPTFSLDFSYDTSSMLRRQLWCNAVAAPTTILRRSLMKQLGDWTGGQMHDYEFWTKAARIARFRYVPNHWIWYRQHGNNVSSGSGAATNTIHAMRMRTDKRAEVSIADLYPALRDVRDPLDAAWAAAHVDMGIGQLRYMPNLDLALAEFDLALSVAPGHLRHLIEFNAAAARRLMGDTSGPEIEQLTGDHPLLVNRRLADGFDALVSGPEISNVPFVLAPARADRERCCDGTPVSLQRVLVVPDWSNPYALGVVVREYWQRFGAGEKIDLAIASAGVPIDDALGLLASVLPPGADWDHAASVTLEAWDSAGHLPAGRFLARIDLNQTREPGNIAMALHAARTEFEKARLAYPGEVRV